MSNQGSRKMQKSIDWARAREKYEDEENMQDMNKEIKEMNEKVLI